MHVETLDFADAGTAAGTGPDMEPGPKEGSKLDASHCSSFEDAGSAETRVVASSRWCESIAKRIFDVTASALILIPLAPVLLFIVLIVRWNSPGPAIFRQQRVGRHGLPFTIFKFRTMYNAMEGSTRSSHGDRRLTAPGRFLRRYKLDELPQLWNVCRGDMSLVGPRPKLHDHHVLDVCFRPGITGAATLAFASEEHLLRAIPHEHLEAYHREVICPLKVELDLEYMARATFGSDLRLLCRTLLRRGRYLSLDQVLNQASNQVEEQCHSASPTVVAAGQVRASVPSAAAVSPGMERQFLSEMAVLRRRDVPSTLSL